MHKKPSQSDTTTPEPYRKYLFAGACYVQVGECYKILSKLRADGKNISDSLEFTNRLESFWENYVTQLPCGPNSELFKEAETKPCNEWVDLEPLIAEISSMTKYFIKSFLESLDHLENNDISLNRFFALWACSSDKAYQKLIESDAYSKSIAKIFNSTTMSPNFTSHK